MGLARKLSLAGPLIGAALTICGANAASAMEYFGLQEVGTNGGSCKIVLSGYTNQPVTKWTKKVSSLTAIAIGEDWKYCPQTINYEGAAIKFDLYKTYKIDGPVFIAYTKNGSKLAFFRQYGKRYMFNWISAPKPPTS